MRNSIKNHAEMLQRADVSKSLELRAKLARSYINKILLA